MFKLVVMLSFVRPLTGWGFGGLSGKSTRALLQHASRPTSTRAARQLTILRMEAWDDRRSIVRRAVATLPEAHSTPADLSVDNPNTLNSPGAASRAPKGAPAQPPLIASKKEIDPRQVSALAERGIETFTEIQELSFDAVYEGKDLLGKSRTGTGKTIAFGLPLIERLADRSRSGEYKQRRGRGPAIVCLTPTRELAKQVESELALLCKTHGLSSVCFHGGVSYTPQERALDRGVDVLVATVGRVIDHLERGTLDLSETYHIVLDESDEMLSMGFAEDVERIFSFTPAGERVGSRGASSSPPSSRKEAYDADQEFFDELFEEELSDRAAPTRAQQQKKAQKEPLARRPQTLLFSATTPSWVKKLTSRYLEDPVFVDVVGDATQQAATTVTHKAVLMPSGDTARTKLLEDIITVEVSSRLGQDCDDAVGGGGRVIVFASTKRECDDLASGPAFKRLSCQVLHGDIGQSQREATLAQFRRGAFSVLIATDVAARGIDIRGVDLVVQYRTPRDSEGYVHRSGRTGRAGRDGTAVILYDEREERDIRTLERECGLKFLRQNPPSPAAVLQASARDATLALAKVNDDVLPYFQQIADLVVDQALAEDDESTFSVSDAEDETEMTESGVSLEDDAKLRKLVAKCLAAIARKQELQPRSLLTGEDGFMTISMTAPRELRTGDVVYAVSQLLERMRTNSNAAGAELDDAGRAVGAVRICEQADKAVFDLPANKARELLTFVDSQRLSKFSFVECHELPSLQRSFSDRNGFRGNGNKRNYGGRRQDRGGSYGRGGDGHYGRGGDGYNSRGGYRDNSRRGSRRGYATARERDDRSYRRGDRY